jgi:hypothetical protein
MVQTLDYLCVYFLIFISLSPAFEADFCHMKAAVDVLKADTQRVSNNEVELAKLWHTIHTETKSIYDNRQMIEDLQRNLTDQV